MGEFSRSGGQQMPTEVRRQGESEHQKDLRESVELKHRHDDEPEKPPWWRFWKRH
jgi:hypothetical protein